MSTAPDDIWLVRPRPVATPRVRVFCFPYAGGGPAAFRPWARDVPPDVEFAIVQMPGREARWREEPRTSVDEVAPAIVAALGPFTSTPFVLFGHSLGSTIAFEVARRLWLERGAAPRRLVCAATRAPHLPSRFPEIRHAPDAQFIDEVNRRYGGVPAEALAEPELLQLMMKGLRADFTIYETYSFREGHPLPCPIVAFGGADDPSVNRSELEGWSAHTAAQFVSYMLPGDHFFVREHRHSVMAEAIRA